MGDALTPLYGKCNFCNYVQPTQDEPSDVRVALSEVFKEYADQALARGDREVYGTWVRAAEIAHDFVVRRVVPL